MPATKLFISHAHEDKTDFVEPLVEALRSAGFEVWYDKYELTLGDRLLQKISQGLQDCDYGVVVMSPDFFRKKWTQAELDGLFVIESVERKVILPVWKGVTVEDVTAFSPILAGRLGVSTEAGVERVVAEIRRAVETSERVRSFSAIENAISRFKALDDAIGGTKNAQALGGSVEGVRIVAEAAKEVIAKVRAEVGQLSSVASHLQIKPDRIEDTLYSFHGSYRLHFLLNYQNQVNNAIDYAELLLRICQLIGPWPEDRSKRRDLCSMDFSPHFHHTGKLVWRAERGEQEFTTEQLIGWIIEQIVDAFEHFHQEAKSKG
jgi:hypothetical protein